MHSTEKTAKSIFSEGQMEPTLRAIIPFYNTERSELFRGEIFLKSWFDRNGN